MPTSNRAERSPSLIRELKKVGLGSKGRSGSYWRDDMSESQDLWVFDDLPEPGVFSGVMTLLGALFGGFLAVYAYLNGLAVGPIATMHVALVIGLGVLFVFLCAAFWFLVGWLIEIAWPLFLLMLFIGGLLAGATYFYFGADGVFNGVSQAVMWGKAF